MIDRIAMHAKRASRMGDCQSHPKLLIRRSFQPAFHRKRQKYHCSMSANKCRRCSRGSNVWIRSIEDLAGRSRCCLHCHCWNYRCCFQTMMEAPCDDDAIGDVHVYIPPDTARVPFASPTHGDLHKHHHYCSWAPLMTMMNRRRRRYSQ